MTVAAGSVERDPQPSMSAARTGQPDRPCHCNGQREGEADGKQPVHEKCIDGQHEHEAHACSQRFGGADGSGVSALGAAHRYSPETSDHGHNPANCFEATRDPGVLPRHAPVRAARGACLQQKYSARTCLLNRQGRISLCAVALSARYRGSHAMPVGARATARSAAAARTSEKVVRHIQVIDGAIVALLQAGERSVAVLSAFMCASEQNGQ